jgi:hypothetical protein
MSSPAEATTTRVGRQRFRHGRIEADPRGPQRPPAQRDRPRQPSLFAELLAVVDETLQPTRASLRPRPSAHPGHPRNHPWRECRDGQAWRRPRQRVRREAPRAWRWLQSSGFADDDALYGPPRHDLGKERWSRRRIGLAVPGRPIGPWSRRTGAPRGIRDRTDRTHAHETPRKAPGRGAAGRNDSSPSALPKAHQNDGCDRQDDRDRPQAHAIHTAAYGRGVHRWWKVAGPPSSLSSSRRNGARQHGSRHPSRGRPLRVLSSPGSLVSVSGSLRTQPGPNHANRLAHESIHDQTRQGGTRRDRRRQSTCSGTPQ